MKIGLFLFFAFLAGGVKAQSDEVSLERALYDLPDLAFKKVSTASDPDLKYELTIRQPLDHLHPEKGYFYQHATLLHKGFNHPTVMETQGYSLYDSRNEVEKILDANDLNIEYRFYGRSLPDSIQWEYLTIEQATADLHAINQLFRKIYKGKWISTGITKGGETTLYYKYFYPGDLDLSVPYVAPPGVPDCILAIREALASHSKMRCWNFHLPSGNIMGNVIVCHRGTTSMTMWNR